MRNNDKFGPQMVRALVRVRYGNRRFHTIISQYLIALAFLLSYFTLPAQNFDMVGWATQAGGTTGGAGGTEVTVSTGTALQDAISNKGSAPLTIYVNGTITPSNSSGLSKIDVKDVSDISIIGVGTSGELNGIGIKIWRASNIIIRNLKIHHVLTGDKDCISIEGPSDHVWVDHNELYNEFQGVGKDDYDGLLDAKGDSEYLTYSWNYLHDSWKASLCGSSESDDFDRKVTYHHNYFRNINSRLPLFRGGQAHIFNNLYEDVEVGCINTRINACVRIENNYFDNANDPWYSADSDVVGDVDESGNIITNGSSFDADDTPPGTCNANIPYSYSSVLESAGSVPGTVMQYVGIGVIDGTPPPPPPPGNFVLTTSVSGQGSVSPNGGTFSSGTTVTLTATAASGWTFSNWSGAASGTNPTVNVVMDANKSVTAVFFQDGGQGGDQDHNFTTQGTSSNFYNISGNLSTSKGTVIYQGLTLTQCLKIESSTSISFTSGQPGDLTLVFNDDFNGGIVVDGTSHNASSGILTLSLGAGSHTITKDDVANLFYMSLSGGGTQEPETFTLSTSVNGQGSVSPSSGTFDEGENVTLTATPASGWQFSGWSGDASGSSSSVTINMNSNKNVTATFTQLPPSQFSLTTSVNGQGSVSPAGGTFNSGSSVTLTATPASGWQFSNWSGDASGTSSSVTITMNSNKSVTANFSQIPSGCSTVEYQMESGSFSSGSVDSNNSGFTGSGFVNTNNATGEWAQITVNVPSSGSHDLALRYANGSSDRPVSVQVNGSTVISNLSMPGAGSWTQWVNASFSVNLNSGNNTIRFTALSSGGAANLDRLDVCQGSTPPPPPQTSTITIQENTTGFCSVDGSVDSNNSGFSGAGFANTDNSTGTGVNWQVNVAGGSYTIVWRYANGGGSNRPGNLLANGSTVASNITFASTGSWTSWTTVSSTVNLAAGNNTLRLQATGSSGLANIDYIEITGGNPAAVSCSGARFGEEGTSDLEADIQVYPNPVSDQLQIELGAFTGNELVRVIDLSGVELMKVQPEQRSVQMDVSHLPAGLYFIQIQNSEGLWIKKLHKQ